MKDLSKRLKNFAQSLALVAALAGVAKNASGEEVSSLPKDQQRIVQQIQKSKINPEVFRKKLSVLLDLIKTANEEKNIDKKIEGYHEILRFRMRFFNLDEVYALPKEVDKEMRSLQKSILWELIEEGLDNAEKRISGKERWSEEPKRERLQSTKSSLEVVSVYLKFDDKHKVLGRLERMRVENRFAKLMKAFVGL